MAAAMASLLKASFCNYYTNRRIIINPTSTTRTYLPINRKIFNIPTRSISQTPLPKITTATKCCTNSSRGSTPKKEEEEEKVIKKAMKEMEKPALTAVLVWVLLTKNPTIASSSLGRTPICFGVCFAYELCKAIASARRIKDGRIRFSLGPVLGSIMFFLLCGFIVLFMMVVFLAALFGSATLTWPPRSSEGSANTTSTTTKLIQV